MKSKKYMILLLIIILVGLSGCVTEKPKGYSETGYPDGYFDHPKLGWMLNKTYYIYETQGIDASTAFISRNPNNIVENGSVKVWISITEDNETYVNTLKSRGVDVLYVLNSTDDGRGINAHAFLPISKIREVGELKFVKHISFSVKPQLD